MPKWNEQQLKAIHTKHKNILVSASAGSGKTTVLIARLMDLVMHDHVSIDAICAMTFTEAAANEMKKRLASELQKAYQNANEEEKIFISKQLTSIQTAHISTIHSFCLSILQNYYYMVGIRAERITHVMDNGQMTQYQALAMEEAFQIQYKKQEEVFVNLTQMFSARPENNEALQSMIVTLATLASSKSNSDVWLSSLSTAYQNIHRIEDLSIDLQENFFEYLLVECRRYEENIQKINELYIVKYNEDVKKHTIVQQKILALPNLFTFLQTKDYTQFRQEFINISHAVVPPCPDKEDKEYAKLRKDILAIEDRMLANLFTEDEFMKDIAKLQPYIEKLVEMCKDYRHAYASLKEKNDCIDFDDMEHFALEILRANDGQIAHIYREQFVEIMVDEFQDSNDVQNDLVNLICKKDNVFRVGDIKQSIYGFRHAKPQLMRGLIDNRGDYDEVIYLSNNYRSKKMIVDFNNELFKQLMNMDGFSCSYAKEDDVDTGVPVQNEHNVPICFHAIFHDEIKEEEHLIIAKNTLKANYIANQIIDIKNKEQRSWKDFVVLVRGNARKDNLKAAFDELHIPYFIDIKYGFYQSSSVQIMLSALKCLCNPHDDIPFVALMMSPLFQRSAQDLAQAKLEKDKKESYYAYYKEHPFPSFEHFKTLREHANTFRLSEMLNALYNVENYYTNHTTIQEKTNLDLLFEKAVQFEQDFASGIESFLAQIEQIKDAQTAEAIPVGSEADVVRVMSIHQSKGLQFPVVFLWSTDNQTPIEFKDYCIADSDLGIAMKVMDLPQRYIRTTIQRIAMEHKKDKEELEEEMRILYVATTRAQQQMHIVDCILSLDTYRHPLTMSEVYNRNGYTSWILQTYLTHPSPLFTIREVHHLWENQIQPMEEVPYQSISLYQHPFTPLQFSTASQAKGIEVPEFTLDKVLNGSLYGTHMHKMIEIMKNQALSSEDIKHIADDISFDIRPNDIQALLNLQKNEIYMIASKKECYYELPFTAQHGTEILHGYMDFVALDENEITIIDFKTDALPNEADFIERYQEQLHTYQKAMKTIYPNKQVQLYIYSFHLHNMIE
ncbi:UvrD-helicase domain-containing protein [Amedibacillus sp. YH-ame6]